MIKEAILWRNLPNDRVECYACNRRCRIPRGSSGFCFVRKNVDGRLCLMNYGVLSSVQLDPIEKKPFNHFLPGSYAFSIGTTSCNFGCLFCLNHNISKERDIVGEEFDAKEIVELARRNGARSIAYTYNEPTIFMEYALDVGKIAHKNGLYNLFVTNGYMTVDAVKEMKSIIDAAVVGFKGNGEQKFANKCEAVPSNEPIKETILEMKRAGMHIEIADLVVSKVGESLSACDRLTKWLYDNLGADVPIQFIGFRSDYKMLDYPSVPFETLKKHYDVAKRNGLNYVYIGNSPYENTHCPNCNSIVIRRDGFYVTETLLDKDMRCKNCGNRIPIKTDSHNNPKM
jgi:pyruvate formate lyase activating enzyme